LEEFKDKLDYESLQTLGSYARQVRQRQRNRKRRI